MTVLDAAESVLATTGTPLGYREIADGILKTRCGRRQARTPHATINAAVAAVWGRYGLLRPHPRRLCRRILWISESDYPPLAPR